MPCHSAKSEYPRKAAVSVSAISNHPRPKTAFHHKNAAEHGRHMKLLRDHCKRMGNQTVDHLPPDEAIRYNDFLQVTGVSNVSVQEVPDLDLKIHPTILPKNEVERIKKASRYQDLEERQEYNNRQEEEAKRAKNESDSRKILLKKIDEEKRKASEMKEKYRNGKTEIDFDEAEKMKVLDRVFVYKQEQEEEVKKANRIILNAKCSVVREAQIQAKHEIGKEIKKEDIKLENQMLDIDRKYVEEDEKKADRFKMNQQLYAEEIRKQLELKERIRFMEVQRMQEECKLQSAAFERIKKDDEEIKKIKNEKRQVLRKDLEKVRETFTKFKQMQFEQEKSDEMKVQQYLRERAERERKIQLERKLNKEAVDRRKQKLYEIQQKLLVTKTNQNEIAIRRDQENKEREFRQKEKEKIMKRMEISKKFVQSREEQILEKKRLQALAIARTEEDFKSTVERLKQDEAKQKEMEEKRLKMKKKYREEILQQMSQKEMERREKEEKAKNEFLAWKQKQEERDRNIKMVIDSKIKALKQSDLPVKYIKDVEKQLSQAMQSN